MAPGWGNRSCDSLLRQVEDGRVSDLVVLPTKTFGGPELDRLAAAMVTEPAAVLTSVSIAGHPVGEAAAWKRFGSALIQSRIERLALGSGTVKKRSVEDTEPPAEDDGCWEALWQGIGASPGVFCLISLDVSSSCLTLKDLQVLGQSVGQLPALRSLDLSRNSFASSTATSSVDPLPFVQLHELDVSSCSLNGSQFAVLISCLTSLSIIRAAHNPLLANNGLSALLHTSRSTIDVTDCGISEIVLPAATTSITMPLSIDTLGLSQNPLGPTVIETLCASTAVRSLNLANHPCFTPEAAALLARSQQSLQDLDVSGTACGVDGAVAIVKECSSLQSIRLFHCKLGSDGFHAIAAALSMASSQLQTLDVAGNGADAAAVVALIQAADATNSLTCLVVGANAGGRAVEEAVQAVVRADLAVARDKSEGTTAST